MKIEDTYKEAMRYIDNVRDTLKNAGKEEKFYVDEKYVKRACGTAYSGALKALDFLFEIKNAPKRRGKKSIEYYQSSLTIIDKKLLNNLKSAYRILHIEGYYEGERYIKTIEAGFENAISVIEAIKPFSVNDVSK
jgi:hypothetical protein